MKPVRNYIEVELKKLKDDDFSAPKPYFVVVAIGDDVTLVKVGDTVELDSQPIYGKYTTESNIIAKGGK